MYLAMFVLVPVGAFMGPPMWIRMYAIKSIEAFHLISLLIVSATIMYIGPIFAGAAGRILSPGMENNDMILIRVIMMEMPVILAVGILCGISAAALSTANSQIHALAEIYTIDIHKRYINSGESEDFLFIQLSFLPPFTPLESPPYECSCLKEPIGDLKYMDELS